MDILLLTPQLPYPPHQGTSLRNYHIICGLARRHRVTLLSFLEPNQSAEPDAVAPLLALCEAVTTVPVPPRATAMRLIQLVTTRLPDMAHRLYSDAFEIALRELLRKRPFAIVQIEGIELARYIIIIREASPSSKIVFDNHNAETELQWRNFLTDIRIPKRLPAAVYSWIQTQRLRRFERWACVEADGVTAVSETDAAILQQLIDNGKQITEKNSQQSTVNSQRITKEDRNFTIHNSQSTIHNSSLPNPQSPILAIPNSIDLEKYQIDNVASISFDLIFAGKMDYRPNVDAVLWFADAVWPLILAKRPLTTWAIVGQKPHARLAHLGEMEGVTLTGWVDSMLPYWRGAKVAVMPFRIGSGTRLKIIEAMATKTAIVSTSVGAEGFPVTSGQELILADDAAGMATAVLDLLDNLTKRTQLTDAAHQFVQQYDWRRVVTRFESLYEEILEG